jgi:hypothetical protein
MEAPVASPSLAGRMGASLAGEWRQAGPAQRFAYLVAGTLVLVGLAHLVAWLVVGGAWQGPVSSRKPTTFGLTTITLAWITGRPQITDRTRWLLLGPLAAADTAEVAWGRRPAVAGGGLPLQLRHPLDTRLFLTGAAAIAVTVTVIVAVAPSPCRRRVDRIRCSFEPRTNRYPAVGSSAVTEDKLAVDVRG